jgi:hypothetical protein
MSMEERQDYMVMRVRSRFGAFAIVVTLAFCLYLPFLSKNYDLNGLTEAAALDSGRPGDLFIPNHLLYRPLGYAIRAALAAVGLNRGPVPILQVLSAAFGALGIGFVYLMVEGLTSNRTIAIWTSLMLAVSWSYWTLSTDVYYLSLSAMFVAATAALFVHAESDWSFVACGALAGISILACEANAFLVPGLAVAILLRDPSLRTDIAVRRIALIFGAAVAVAGLVFASVGIVVYRERTVAELLKWVSSYSGGGSNLPMWGAWSPSRLLLVAGSAFKSVVGLELWMFQFFQRHLPNGQVPGWVASLGFGGMTGGLAAALLRGRAKRSGETRTALWLFLLYCSYVPFIVWWEPTEPRWFILPNIFMAGLAGFICSHWRDWPRLKYVLPAGFLMVGGLNLMTSAWPRRFEASVPSQMAACVAGRMSKSDLFLATEWNWAGYLHYIHNRDVLSFIEEVSRTGDKGIAIVKISEAVRERQRQGAQVYMMDIKNYPPQYMKWLSEQTGLTADDLKPYTGQQTFECVYSTFFQVDPQTPAGKP